MQNKPKVGIITLMRKGSKRFPNKYKAELMGRPLYMHTVDFAMNLARWLHSPYYLIHDCGVLDLPMGVTQIDEKPEHAGDVHDNGNVIKSYGLGFDIFILLQVTNPIRHLNKTKAWINNFIEKDIYQVGFSAKKLPKGFYYSKDAIHKNYLLMDRDYNGAKSDSIFIESGSFYIFKKEMLDFQHIIDTGQRRLYQDPYNYDINYPEDILEIENKLMR